MSSRRRWPPPPVLGADGYPVGSLGRLYRQLDEERGMRNRPARLRRAYAAMCARIGERGSGGRGVTALLCAAERTRFTLQREGWW